MAGDKPLPRLATAAGSDTGPVDSPDEACHVGRRAMTIEIRMADSEDIDPFMSHLELVQAQSGRDGVPIFTPFSPDQPADYTKMRERRLTGWAIPISQCGWRRAWAAIDDGVVVGDLELQGGSIPSEMHRAALGMALQSTYSGQGLGTRLMEAAIQWSRDQGLEYIDLGVFDGNEPAMRLYDRFGFERVGIRRDAFRVGEDKVDDILMVLAL